MRQHIESTGSSFPLVILSAPLSQADPRERTGELRALCASHRATLVELTPAMRIDKVPDESTHVMRPFVPSELQKAVVGALARTVSPRELPLTVSGDGIDSAVPSPDVRGLRVLLAEDNYVNQRLAVRLLERDGCLVEIAENGDMAVAAFRRSVDADEPFDIVLMDVQMPGMSGTDATRLIRETENGSRIPIVALTARAMKEDEAACLEAGMDAYLSKPFNPEALSEVLARLTELGK